MAASPQREGGARESTYERIYPHCDDDDDASSNILVLRCKSSADGMTTCRSVDGRRWLAGWLAGKLLSTYFQQQIHVVELKPKM